MGGLENKQIPFWLAGMSADNVRGLEIVRKILNIWPRSEAARANVKGFIY